MLPLHEVNINVLTSEHCKLMAGLHQKCFDNYWSDNDFEEFLKQPEKHFIGVFLNKKLIGFIGIILIVPEVEILTLCIRPMHRRINIATLLLNSILKYCYKNNIEVIHLEVNYSNIAAINFYKKHCFTISGLRKNYYVVKNGYLEDAILMKLILKNK